MTSFNGGPDKPSLAAAPVRDAPQVPAPFKFYLALALIALAVLVAGYFIYVHQQRSLRSGVEQQVSAIAQLKADEISRWRTDRLAYADTITGNEFYPTWVTQWKASPSPALEATLRARLVSEARRYSYLDLLVTDTGGAVLDSLNGTVIQLNTETVEQLGVSLRDRRSVMTELYIDTGDNKPHINVIAPLFTGGAEGEQAVGAVVFCIDPAQYLYPLIQSWPLPSSTGEIELVKKDGDSALFLNGLRFQPDSAFKLRMPLSETGNVAVMAATGKGGVVEGKDYRGSHVLAALQKVPGSQWSVVAKIDSVEALADWQWQSGLIVAIFITLLAAALSVIGLFWQRRQRLAYQALYKVEKALVASETKFRNIIEHSGDVFYMFDLAANPLYLSPRSLELIGYTPEEFSHIKWTDLLTDSPVNRAAIKSTLAAVRTGVKQPPYPMEFIRKDGTVATAELNESPLKDAAGKVVGLCGVMRDITDRIRAEQALKESENRVRAKLEAILSPVGDMSALELADIVDTRTIQLMMDDFFRLTKIGIAILDLNGRVLVATGWQDICTRFHRIHPETCRNCLESDMLLSQGVEAGKYKVYRCKNNMWDMATPLTAGGRQIGSLFLGQFLFEDEKPDYDIFRSQARQYGFNEEDYIAALERVPRWNRQTVDAVMSFYTRFAMLVSRLSHGNIMLARALAQNESTLAALKDSEEKFRAIAERSSDVVYLTDEKGAIVFISAAAEAVFGFKPAEMTGRNFVDFLAPSDIEKAISVFMKAIEQDLPSNNLELSMKRKDGTLFFGELRGALINLANFTGTAGVIRDITARRQAEDQLRSSEERFSAAFGINPDPTAITEIDTGRIIDINPAYEKWSGYTRSELIGRSTRELNLFVDGGDRDKLISRLQQSQAVEDMPVKFRIRSGEIRDIWFSASLIELGGKPYLFTRGHDVTDFNRMQQALQDSEEKYRLLVENAHEAIYVAVDGVLIFGNNRAAQLSGYSQEELSTRPFSEFIHPEDRDRVVDRYLRRLAGEEIPSIYSFRIIDKAGNTRWVELNAVLINWEGKRATLNFLTDVTDRRRLEEEQQRVTKLESVGLLAGGIAHDFNNVLTSILGNISLARLESEPGSEIRNSLEQAEKASLQAKNLTQQLLTFSKGGAPVKKLASLTDLIRDTAGFSLHGSNIKCHLHIPSDLWHAEIDAGQISQVIHNLVINAQQSMPSGGTIDIRADNMTVRGTQSIGRGLPLSNGNYIRVAVTDHGGGIEAQHLDKVFDPFFTTKQKGSGLGLATSFSIARNHGGHLSVESTVGSGSTFYLYLPASVEKLAPGQYTKMLTNPSHTARILVMDDEPGVRDVAGRMLRHLGFKDIEFAADGAVAVKLYEAAMKTGRPFGVVMLDLTIPGGMGGIDTVSRLLQIDPGARAIVSSGYADKSVMAEYKEYGFMGMVAKPYTLEDLGNVLNDVIN